MISVTALLVAVLGFTPVGEAAKNIVLKRDSVTSKHIKNKSIKNVDLKKNSVGSGKVTDNTLLSSDIRDGQVATADLADSAVAAAKIAAGAVGSTKLAAKSVTTSKLAGGPAARVRASAATAIPDSAFTTIPFNLETFDVTNMHGAVVNSSRITIATAGLYVIGANVSWAANAAPALELSLRVNGTTFVARVRQAPAGMSTSDQSVSTLVDLNAGDYVEVVVRQASGAAVSILSTPQLSPEFWATWVGPAQS